MAKGPPPPQTASISSTESPVVWQGTTCYVLLGLIRYFLISIAEGRLLLRWERFTKVHPRSERRVTVCIIPVLFSKRGPKGCQEQEV